MWPPGSPSVAGSHLVTPTTRCPMGFWRLRLNCIPLSALDSPLRWLTPLDLRLRVPVYCESLSPERNNENAAERGAQVSMLLSPSSFDENVHGMERKCHLCLLSPLSVCLSRHTHVGAGKVIDSSLQASTPGDLGTLLPVILRVVSKAPPLPGSLPPA